MIAPEVFIESKSARDGQLVALSHERSQEVLAKAKGLVFAVWQGVGAATTEQMADFYEVDKDAVESVLRRHRDEFKSDGVNTLKGNQLKTFRYASVNLTEASSRPLNTVVNEGSSRDCC